MKIPIPNSHRSLLGLTASALVLLGTGGSVFGADAAVNSTDKSFLKDAAQGGIAEVKMGEMAAKKSGNADVKAFGERMVQDHSKANEELKTLAANKKVEIPTDASLKDQAKMKLDDMKSGADYDMTYAEAMVTDHKKDVKEFEKEIKAAKDPDVKAFAEKTLPTLKEHLAMAEELQKKVQKK